jgi:hypothetical protein
MTRVLSFMAAVAAFVSLARAADQEKNEEHKHNPENAK